MLDIDPKKCCVKFDPPTQVLFYEITKEKKIHRRSIPIKNLPLKQGGQILKELFDSHHGKYIERFKKEQIIRVLNILIEKNNGTSIKVNQFNDKETFGINMDEDNLNKLNDEKLNEVKKHMNSSFVENQVKPGDDNWEYDINVDFDDNIAGGIESAGWDEEESDMEF